MWQTNYGVYLAPTTQAVTASQVLFERSAAATSSAFLKSNLLLELQAMTIVSGETNSNPSNVAADASVLLARLDLLSTITFASPDKALQLYCATAMELVGLNTAFVSRIYNGVLEVLESSNPAGVVAGEIIPLEDTFCQHVYASGAPVVIADSTRDPRVCDLVARRGLDIGAYLGVPITLPNGTPFGTFCTFDPKPQTFDAVQQHFMRIAARQLATLLAPSERHTRTIAVPAIADAAQHALVAQQQVLRTVAHDLRSPLTGIMGGCEFLTTELPGPLTTDQHEVVEQLYRTSQLMHRLVNDLLDASGSAQPTLSITTKRLDPCVVAQQAHAMCRDAATARGLRCEFHRPATIPTILSDHDRLLQILLNLLRNAVQYTTTGGVVLRVGTYDEHVEFRVDDTGPGIDPAVQAAMWQEFQRATSEGNGYGLGLAIVQRLVKALGGTVGVDSVPGEGSSFWVRFPCEAPAS